jgi:hypothetical protein
VAVYELAPEIVADNKGDEADPAQDNGRWGRSGGVAPADPPAKAQAEGRQGRKLGKKMAGGHLLFLFATGLSSFPLTPRLTISRPA